MKKTSVPTYFIIQFLFWILFFALCRIVFIIHIYSDVIQEVSFWELFPPFWHGLSLDFSTIGYILIIPFVLLLPNLFTSFKFTERCVLYYSYIVIFIISTIVCSELPLHDEWGTKMNYKALKYLTHPSEVVNSTSTWNIIFGFIKILALTAIGIVTYRKWAYRTIYPSRVYVGIPFFILIPGLLLVLMRGGFQQIPIQQSDVYYSKVNNLNLAAVNSVWNLGQSFLKNRRYLNHNPYNYYSSKEAKAIVDELYEVKKDTTLQILKTDRPNIILIIQESWSADLNASLGGYSGITPGFDSLANEGLLFTNIYATGARSDQGMAAIFSGFPAQPTTSIIKQPAKYVNLPCISIDLKKQGYETSYIFAGQLSYGNIKSYMMYNQFDKLVVGADFPDKYHQSKLGVPDEFMFDRNLKMINQLQPPFFSGCFTISPHAPYDIPAPYTIEFGGEHNGYLNAVHYSDSCMVDFIKKCSKYEWYENTLFIIIADHSHNSPKEWGYYSPNYHKIPMLFFGPALKDTFKQKKVEKVGTQYDLVSTLLNQLNISDSSYHWSKNLLNPYTRGFAFYAIDDGVGWVRPDSYFVWEHSLKRFYGKKFSSQKNEKAELRNGKAYLQRVFQTYLEK